MKFAVSYIKDLSAVKPGVLRQSWAHPWNMTSFWSIINKKWLMRLCMRDFLYGCSADGSVTRKWDVLVHTFRVVEYSLDRKSDILELTHSNRSCAFLQLRDHALVARLFVGVLSGGHVCLPPYNL
jgi:hypothetical protein